MVDVDEGSVSAIGGDHEDEYDEEEEDGEGEA